MKTHRVEIRPGYFIEIDARLKRKAGVKGKKFVRTRITDQERRRILGDVAYQRNGCVKYSRLLLDEAVEISKVHGVKKAVKLTGIKYWSIVGHKRELARRGEFKPWYEKGLNRHCRYTLKQKQDCVRLAQRLMADPSKVRSSFVRKGKPVTIEKPKWSQRPAFIEAGKRLGMNGTSIEFMWTHQMIKP